MCKERLTEEDLGRSLGGVVSTIEGVVSCSHETRVRPGGEGGEDLRQLLHRHGRSSVGTRCLGRCSISSVLMS